MPTEQYRRRFNEIFDTEPYGQNFGFTPVSMDERECVVRWTPPHQWWTDLDGSGTLVFGGSVGTVLHWAIWFAAMVVFDDDEAPMTLQEECRYYRPVMFDRSYLLTGTPRRRTRTTLWTSATLSSDDDGTVLAESSALSQIVRLGT